MDIFDIIDECRKELEELDNAKEEIIEEEHKTNDEPKIGDEGLDHLIKNMTRKQYYQFTDIPRGESYPLCYYEDNIVKTRGKMFKLHHSWGGFDEIDKTYNFYTPIDNNLLLKYLIEFYKIKSRLSDYSLYTTNSRDSEHALFKRVNSLILLADHYRKELEEYVKKPLTQRQGLSELLFKMKDFYNQLQLITSYIEMSNQAVLLYNRRNKSEEVIQEQADNFNKSHAKLLKEINKTPVR